MSLNLKKIVSLFENNNFSEAVIELNKYSDENKNSFIFYFYRGISYFKLNRFDEAKKDFEKSILINPRFSEVYYNLGVLNYTLGENENAIDNFLGSLKINNKFLKAFIGLTNSLSHTKDYYSSESKIVQTHNMLNEINFNYTSNEPINDNNIKIYLKKINKIIDTTLDNINFNITQTYRRHKPPLLCDRHKTVFNTYEVIPKFCFNCYKIQIDVDNVVDLIKLFLVFDNINLVNKNTRKCMIETRSNISSKYKGLILCSSIKETENIKNMLEPILNKNINKFNCKIKRGCTEYGMKYSNYDDLSTNAMKYKPEWKKYEDLIDEKHPDLTYEKKTRPTIKGLSLYDSLVIRNWLAYARLVGDKSYENVTEQIFYSKFIENTLKKNNLIN